MKKWILAKPGPDDMDLAMQEYRELIGFCVQAGIMQRAPESLNRLINWAWSSQIAVPEQVLGYATDKADAHGS